MTNNNSATEQCEHMQSNGSINLHGGHIIILLLLVQCIVCVYMYSIVNECIVTPGLNTAESQATCKNLIIELTKNRKK